MLRVESGNKVGYQILGVSSFTSHFLPFNGVHVSHYCWVLSAPPVIVVDLVSMLVYQCHAEGQFPWGFGWGHKHANMFVPSEVSTLMGESDLAFGDLVVFTGDEPLLDPEDIAREGQ